MQCTEACDNHPAAGVKKPRAHKDAFRGCQRCVEVIPRVWRVRLAQCDFLGSLTEHVVFFEPISNIISSEMNR